MISGGIFDPEATRQELAEIEEKIGGEEFWSDASRKVETKEILRRRTRCQSRLDRWKGLVSAKEEVEVLLELASEGEDVASDLKRALTALDTKVQAEEIATLLSGEYDANNAIVEIHPGAGGTESMDFAAMLLRMYLRFCERKGYTTRLLERQEGEEAGIKSATIMVEGEYAYGTLRGETGVHRLVRISPFDAAKRRHTSFAACLVLPDLPEEIEVEIDPKDLRIDTYHSSGAGGQHVNVTDSAVRITHLPTKTVVSCQNERSQHRNRDMAMKVLKARLYQLERAKHEAKVASAGGEKREIGWGSQIRSYVLQPYQMAKDLRTKSEVGNVSAVLDGDLDRFIKDFLVWSRDRKGSG